MGRVFTFTLPTINYIIIRNFTFMNNIKNILGIENDGVFRLIVVILLPYYFLMDTYLYEELDDIDIIVLSPGHIEEFLDDNFGKKEFIKPITEKEKIQMWERDKKESDSFFKFLYGVDKDDYEGWKNSPRHIKKNWNKGYTYKYGWEHSYRITCVLYTLFTYFLLIKTTTWVFNGFYGRKSLY